MSNSSDQMTLDNFLNFSNSLDSVEESVIDKNPFLDKRITEVSEPIAGGEGNVMDFLAQSIWGGIHGLTWGASGFEQVKEITGQEEKTFEEMNDWEKAGWVTGEGLSLLVPFVGPFAILGKGGNAIAKTFGNTYLKKSAIALAQKDGALASAYVKAAQKNGQLTGEVASSIQRNLGKEIPSGLNNKFAISKLRDLTADTKTALAAEPYLKAQSMKIIDKVLGDAGMQVAEGTSRAMSKEFVESLSKGKTSGRYVNDAAEMVTKWFGGQDPGKLSKYLGMAAQDFLYMGLHSIGIEKIDSLVEERAANYGHIPAQTGLMALGFPLIRGIKGGGNESLARGAKAYFDRFRKIDYKALQQQDKDLARALLESNVKGGHFNIFNSSALGESFWKVGSKEYRKPSDILNGIKGIMKDGKLTYDMPDDHVVTLLNKMRVASSKEFMKRFRGNYFSDLWASKYRLGTGILFMNEGLFRTGAFDGMGEQELASHLFISALMTKSRGAWGHAEGRGYIAREYGDINRGLEYLQADHTKFGETLVALTERQIAMDMGAMYSASPISDSIVKAFDSVFEKENYDWVNRTGKPSKKEINQKVQTLLSAYNGIKYAQDRNFGLIEIDNINPEALAQLRTNVNSIKIDGQPLGQIAPGDLHVKLVKETEREIGQDYYNALSELGEKLGLPWHSADGKFENGSVATEIRVTNVADEGRHLHNISAWNEFLGKYKSVLRIDVKSGTDVEPDATKLAKEKGFETLSDFDNAIGEFMGKHMDMMGGKYQNHNIHLPWHTNLFLDGLKNIRGIKSKDDLYNAVMGTDTAEENVRNLHIGIMSQFGVDGKLNRNIGNFDRKKKPKSEEEKEFTSRETEDLLAIEPIFNLMRKLKVGTTDRKPQEVDMTTVRQLADYAREIKRGLPEEWRNETEAIALDTFQFRMLGGGNRMAMGALEMLRNEGLITKVSEGGILKISLPNDAALESLITDPATATEVKVAAMKIERVFSPGLVTRTPEIQFGSDNKPIDYTILVEIADVVSNKRSVDFIDNIDKIISSVAESTTVSKELVGIKVLAEQIQSKVKGDFTDATPNEIIELNKRMRTIFEGLKNDGLIFGEVADKIEAEISISEKRIRDEGDYIANRQLDWKDIIGSIDQYVKIEIHAETREKRKLANLVTRIENAMVRSDDSLSSADSRLLLERLTGELNKIVKESEYSTDSLQDLIKEFNNSFNWRDLKKSLDSIMKTVHTRANAHRVTYNEQSVNALIEMKNQKIEERNRKSSQQIILKYESIQDSADRNKINMQFKSDLDVAIKDRTNIDDVFNKYIYKELEGKLDGNKYQKAVRKFKREEAIPLLQSIYGSVERQKLTLDHDKLKAETTPVKRSLSTDILDRVGQNDELGSYKYFILGGTVKLNDRTMNLDLDRRLGGNWTSIQNLLDRTIPVNMDNVKDLWNLAANSHFKLETWDVETLRDPIMEDGAVIYMRLSPTLRIMFPKTSENLELLNTDFKEIYNEKLSEYGEGGLYESVVHETALKKGFKHLLNSETSANTSEIRTKMMFVHQSRALGSELDNLLGNLGNRGKIEFNMFKRGFIADGGTGTELTTESLTWAGNNHTNNAVARQARRILDRPKQDILIDVYNDETGFFDNAKNVEKKLGYQVDRLDAVQDNVQIKAIQEFNKRIASGEYSSLSKDSFFLDGQEFASTDMAKLIWAMNGNPKDFNGSKVYIMDGSLLGKGYIIYHPDISPNIRGDILVGKTVAKTLRGASTNSAGDRVRYYEFSGAEHMADRQQQHWTHEFGNMENINQISIPHRSFGVGWGGYKETGVNLSSSMVDFQNQAHTKDAINLFNIDKIIQNLKSMNEGLPYANNELVRALYKLQNEQLAFTSDSYNLTEKMAEWGATEVNPLITKDVLKLLQGEFYEVLTKRGMKDGEEAILAADIQNRLSLPKYLSFTNESKYSSDIDFPFTGIRPSSLNAPYQFGGGTISNSLGNVKLGNRGIKDIPFIARDNVSGVDYYFVFDGKKIRRHSSFADQIKSGTSIEGEGDLAGLFRETDPKSGREGKLKINKDFIAETEAVINNLNSILDKIDKPTHKDIFTLLKGQDLSLHRRLDKRERYPLGLYNNKKDGFNRRNAKKYKMATGMSVNSIPKVLKDQPIVRIEDILGKNMDGLTTINNFDLRVTLQRDFDGDHLYKYLRMPYGMMKDYINDMGNINDYYMFSDKNMMNSEGIEFNAFGFNDMGKAGVDHSNVGFDNMANHVAKQKMIVSTVIGIKGTLSYLKNSGLMYGVTDPQPLVSASAHAKGTLLHNMEAKRIFQRSGDIFQNALDIWDGTHPVAHNLETIKNYFLYGDLPAAIRKGDDTVLKGHTEESWFGREEAQAIGSFGSKPIERKIFDIIHRTLNKTKMMARELYTDSGKRQPLPKELRDASKDIDDFFSHPNKFLLRKMMDSIRYNKKKGQDVSSETVDLIEFFFTGKGGVSKGSKNYNEIFKYLETGKVKQAYKYMAGNRKFSFDQSMPSVQERKRSSVSGHVLDRAVKEPIFFRKDGQKWHTTNRTITTAIDNMQRQVESMLTFGEYNVDQMEQILATDNTIGVRHGKKGAKARNQRGIMRFIVNREFARENSRLRTYLNEKFPDENKILRSEDRLTVFKSMADILDLQMARDFVLDKQASRSVNPKDMPFDKGGDQYGTVKFQRDGQLYRYKPSQLKEKGDEGIDYKSLQFVSNYKKGKIKNVERGWTYILDSNPVRFEVASDPEARYNHAWYEATMTGNLTAESSVFFRDVHSNPVAYSAFDSAVKELKYGINDEYSSTIGAIKKQGYDYKDKFHYNQIVTESLIDRFFDNYVLKQGMDFELLMRYVMQPTPHRNVYYKDGDVEIPYFGMNTRLIKSIFSWMRRPARDGQLNVDQKFNIESDKIIKDLITDMEQVYNHTLDEPSLIANRYSNMKKAGNIEWDKYKATTTDLLLGEWFHHPVLSKVVRDFFPIRPSIRQGFDIMDERINVLDYSKGPPKKKKVNREYELGCE